MKVTGQTYLERTLAPTINEVRVTSPLFHLIGFTTITSELWSISCALQIFEARKSCEIDTAKLAVGDNVDVNMANLMFFVVKIISAITSSARSCPRIMCTVFAMLRKAAVNRFPGTHCPTKPASFGFVVY